MTGFILLKVPTSSTDALSAVLGKLPGVIGIEELPASGANHFAVDPRFNVVEYGTATAAKFDEWLAAEKFRRGTELLLKVYVTAKSQADWNQWLTKFLFDHADLAVVEYGTVPDQDYTAAYRARIHGRNVGKRLWVGPPWETSPTDKIAIVIDPGMAFGSGDHPTTQLCLELMESLAHPAVDLGDHCRAREGDKPRRVLDIGTGSGVLAIATAKLWPECELWISDLDEKCRENAEGNFKLNGIEFPKHAFWGPPRRSGIVPLPPRLGSSRAKFDLILSNIYLESLKSLIHPIAGLLSPQARWLVSGLLGQDQKQEFIEQAGKEFAVGRILERDGWCAIELQKQMAGTDA